MNKKAFTLAEVLITLGIIGVVAALTMPVLIAQHTKKATAAKLKKYYSTLQQAYLMLTQEDNITCSGFNSASPDLALDFFNATYGQYFKVAEIYKKKYGIMVALSDGTGIYVRKAYGIEYGGNPAGDCNGVNMNFCTDYKYCKDRPEATQSDYYSGRNHDADGRKLFTFTYAANAPNGRYLDRQQLKNYCAGQPLDGYKEFCTTLIQLDGWEIADDYPW